MARTLTVNIIGDASSLQRSYRQAEASTKSFGRNMEQATRGGLAASLSFRGLGRSAVFASGAFLGGMGLTSAIKGSIDAASNLAEATSKANVVFGASSKAVENWSKTSVNAMGLASDQAIETAGSFGALLTPLGITGKVAADQSMKLTQLGADLASFYNTSVQDALDAIRSGLVGESEPLRKYGVQLNEARVQAEAMAQTGKQTAASLTVADKALARQAIIYRDTAKAQGDFARTSGGLANQQRIFAANLRQLQITLGTALLPAITKIIKGLNDWFGKSENQRHVTEQINDVAKTFTGVIQTMLPVLSAAVGLVADLTGAVDGARNAMILFGAAWSAQKIAKRLGEVEIAAVAASAGTGRAAAGAGQAATQTTRLGKAASGATGFIGGFVAALNPYVKVIAAAAIGGKLLTDHLTDLGDKMLDAKKGPEETSESLRAVVPRLAELDTKLKAAGVAFPERLKRMRTLLGGQGGDTIDTMIAQAIRLERGDPKITAAVKKVQDDAAKVGQDAGDAAKKGLSEGAKRAKAAQRHREWFDDLVSGQLGRISNLPLGQQNAALRKVADELEAEGKNVTDVTRKLNLNNQRLGVLKQITDNNKEANDNLKEASQKAFDAALGWIDVAAERATWTKGLEDDRAAAQRRVTVIEARIKVEGRTLELVRALTQAQSEVKSYDDQIAQNDKDRAKNAADRSKTAWQRTLSRSQLQESRAANTKGLQDDLRTARHTLRLLKEYVRTHGSTVELQEQITAQEGRVTSAQEAIAQGRKTGASAARAARQARQYRALGLTATGEERIPGIPSLRAQARQAEQALKGTVLDTNATTNKFAQVANLLSGKFGKLTRDTRGAIKSWLDSLSGDVDKAVDQTKFRHTSSQKLAEYLLPGASPAQRAKLMAGLSTVGPGMSVPAGGGTGQFGGGINIHGNVIVHGVQDPRDFEDKMQKRTKARAHTRRGAR